MKVPKPSFDVQIGLEFNKAIIEGDGDSAALAFAEMVRSSKLIVSDHAWSFLEKVVRAQRGSDPEENGGVKEASEG